MFFRVIGMVMTRMLTQIFYQNFQQQLSELDTHFYQLQLKDGVKLTNSLVN